MTSPARTLRLLPSRADAPAGERRARGRALRKRLSRPDQGKWQPDVRRADPLEVLARAERGRLPALLPIKHGRMAASPFTFFRGAVPVMAADLARLPVTGLAVQICGDAHVRNLGAFAAPDGHLVFDINDFDETIRAPWEWDMKRLATSLVLAGRESGMRDRACLDAVTSLAPSYGAGLRRFAEMPVLELLRWEISRHTERGPVHVALHKAERVSPHDVQTWTDPLVGWTSIGGRPFLVRQLADHKASVQAGRPARLGADGVCRRQRRAVRQGARSHG